MGKNGTGTRDRFGFFFFFFPERISTCEKKNNNKDAKFQLPETSAYHMWSDGFFFCQGGGESHAVLCEDKSVLL